VYIYYADYVTVSRCTFTDIKPSTGSVGTGYGVYEGDGECIKLTVENCQFIDSDATATLYVGVLSIQSLTLLVNNCSFVGSMQSGVQYGAVNSIISNCFFDGCGIWLGSGSGSIKTPSTFTVSNNYIVNVPGNGVYIGALGGSMEVQQAVVKNNYITKCEFSGICLEQGRRLISLGNTIIDCNTSNSVTEPYDSGIAIYNGGINGGLIDGNYIENTTAGHMKYAISRPYQVIQITDTNRFIGMETDSVRVPITVAPTGGTWAIGTKLPNWSPVSGSAEGIICTVSGTPGTWKTYGSIS
jgi:hypothetical protein